MATWSGIKAWTNEDYANISDMQRVFGNLEFLMERTGSVSVSAAPFPEYALLIPLYPAAGACPFQPILRPGAIKGVLLYIYIFSAEFFGGYPRGAAARKGV